MEIMAQADSQEATEDLFPPTDSATHKTLYTPTEAREYGITWPEDKQPPPPEKCQFCGRLNEREGVALFGKIILWMPETIPIRCKCEKAQAYWAEYDRLQEEAKRQREEEERVRLFRDRCKKLLLESGMKKRFLRRTFRNYECRTPEMQRAFDIALDYARNFESYAENGKGLYFEGTNGTGKTHLAAAIAISLLANGIPVIFKTGEQLLADIRRTYDEKGISEYEVFDIYMKADLLVIDDLGKEQCTEWAMTALYKILNARYEDMKPTIITTNYNADGLEKAMTPQGGDNCKIAAIISRLRGVNSVVTMVWDDWRRNGGN